MLEPKNKICFLKLTARSVVWKFWLKVFLVFLQYTKKDKIKNKLNSPTIFHIFLSSSGDLGDNCFLDDSTDIHLLVRIFPCHLPLYHLGNYTPQYKSSHSCLTLKYHGMYYSRGFHILDR